MARGHRSGGDERHATATGRDSAGDGIPSEVPHIQGKDTDWGGLNDYIAQFDETVEPYINKAKQLSLGGGNLLVDQAILK